MKIEMILKMLGYIGVDIISYIVAILVFGMLNEFNPEKVLKGFTIWIFIYYLLNTYILRYKKSKLELNND